MKDLGIEVVIKTELPKVEEAFGEYLVLMTEARSVGKFKTTTGHSKVEEMFLAIALTRFRVTVTSRLATRKDSASL